MGKKEDDAYKAWLADLQEDAAGITDPEEKKAVELILKSETIGRRVAKGVTGSKHLYQELNTLNEEKNRFRDTQETWKNWRDDVNNKFQTAVQERDALKAELKDKERAARALGLDDDADDLRAARTRVDDSLTQNELKKLRDDLKAQQDAQAKLANGIPGFMAAALRLSKQYQKDGIEVDDQEAILTAVRDGVPLDNVYSNMTAPQYEKRAKEREDKLIKDAEARGREQALTQKSSPEGFRPTSGVFSEISKGSALGDKLAAARAAARSDALQINR